MKGCPRCAATIAWVLADGRRKCQSCGRRYSWRSVWDSVRLNAAAKQALLDAFVRGEPAARCAAFHACADSCERFYRLARACCARHEGLTRDGTCIVEYRPPSWDSRPAFRGWLASSHVMVIGIAERETLVHISAPAGAAAGVLPLLRERVGVGGVMQLDDTQAYACLPIRGEYVIVPQLTRAALVTRPAEEFWHYARAQLQACHKISLRFFPLYLAEASLRFNHRSRDLRVLLMDMMTATPIGELKQLLIGETCSVGPDRAGSARVLRDTFHTCHEAAS